MLRVRAPVSSAAGSRFQWCLEVPAPEPIAVGHGSAVHLAGWCFHKDAAVRELRFVAAGSPTPALAHSLPRPDVRAALFPAHDPHDHSYASGFYAVVPLPGTTVAAEVALVAHVDLVGGATEEHLLDVLKIVPRGDFAPPPARSGSSLAVCMATYNPAYDLFARQIESLTRQSYGDWLCIVSDDRSDPQTFDRMRRLLEGDERFVVDRSRLHLGAYRNFERALGRVPQGSRYVALCDQDDRWRPDKLEKLLAALESGAALAYSDCRLVRPDGAVLADTLFVGRGNNSTDLRKMLLANSVPGAASMFRADLLDDLLPFPPDLGPRVSLHDHWLAVVAVALGPLGFIGSPLYDWIQHDRNAIGHALAHAQHRGYPGPWMLRSRSAYESKLLRTALMSTALEQRLRGRMAAADERSVRSLVDLGHSNKALARLAVHAVGASSSTSATEGTERDLLSAVAWARRMMQSARRRDRIAHPWYAAGPSITDEKALPGDLTDSRALSEAVPPLPLQVSEALPTRVNVLMRRIELDDALDSDIGKLSLAASLADAGLDTRVIVAGGDVPGSDVWARLQSVHGTPAAERRPEIVASRSPVHVSPADVFIATDWSTAHAAHTATALLRSRCFLYVIDEYAGDGVSPGLRGEIDRSYAFPHCALFWNARVEAYFRSGQLGVFSPDRSSEPPFDTLVPAVRRLGSRPGGESAAPRRLGSRPGGESAAPRSRALLFHAPEGPAGSMLALGLRSLHDVASAGLLSDWEVNVIGAPMPRVVRVAPDLDAMALGPVTMQAYGDLLAAHDLGMSLAPTHRLTSVPLEMAAVGLPTVTAGVDADDRHRLAATSANLIPVQPTAEDVGRGLVIALERMTDLEGRARGSALEQPSSWAEMFSPVVVERIGRLLDSCGKRTWGLPNATGRAMLRRVRRGVPREDAGSPT